MPPRDRARPMSPQERRAHILRAARPLLLEHGRGASTRQIAEAAGIAEGTVFRVFPTKDDLFAAVVEQEFDPDPFLEALAAVDLEQPLEDRLVEAVSLLQGRFVGIFQLLVAMGHARPPEHLGTPELRQRLAKEGLVRILEPDASRFRVPPAEVVQMLRLLTFSGSHPHIVEQRLTPAGIVDLVLHGTLLHEAEGR